MRMTRAVRISIAALTIWSGLAAAQNRDPQKKLQKEVASKTASFGTITKADEAYQKARDAHDLTGAQKVVGQTGSFKGIVTKLFEERDGDLVILDFDTNYRSALTAILRNSDFPKFPDMRSLEGKEVVVTGKFTEYQGRAQVEITEPGQIKLVN